MATPNEPRREHPSTYVVQDRSSEEELSRLRLQDELITDSMGGVLSEQPNASSFRSVLDVGCGSGNWALAVARTYPEMSVAGVDISGRMIEFARAQATEQGVSDRVEFRVMDALRMLEFPNNSFDLVNLRFGVSWMRKWDWPKLISEFQRISRPGGVIRVTELQVVQESSSPAFTQLQEMLQCALFRAGHLFEQETTGLTAHLVPLLTQHSVQQVQTKAYSLEYRAGTPQGQAYYEGWMYALRTFRPFLQKWGCLSANYDEIRQQALDEMQRSDFHVTTPMLTAWGKTSQNGTPARGNAFL